MNYTITETASLLGVTTYNLRYYEKMGIIQPIVNEETGYRYYSVLDTRRFNLARFYRGMGFSMEECRELLSGSISIQDTIEQQESLIQKEIIFNTLKLQEMKHYRSLLELLELDLEQSSIVELDDYIRIEFSDDEEITRNKQILKLRNELLEYTPLVKWVSRIPKLSFDHTLPLHYHYGLNMKLSYAKALGIDTEKYIHIPKGKYLLTFFRKDKRCPYELETMTRALDYIHKHKMQNYGDAYSCCLKSIGSEENYQNYHYFIVKLK